MAWRVAPVATAAATTTVGVAGILGTWRTGSKSLAHERLLAKEAREQERLANAYGDLLDMRERTGHWAQISYPLWDANPPQRVPDLPSLEEQAHAEALVSVFSSSMTNAQKRSTANSMGTFPAGARSAGRSSAQRKSACGTKRVKTLTLLKRTNSRTVAKPKAFRG